MVKDKTREVKITDRELSVIDLISHGYTDCEIAEELKISKTSLRSLLSYLYCRTHTLNRQHLVAWAFRKKIIK